MIREMQGKKYVPITALDPLFLLACLSLLQKSQDTSDLRSLYISSYIIYPNPASQLGFGPLVPFLKLCHSGLPAPPQTHQTQTTQAPFQTRPTTATTAMAPGSHYKTQYCTWLFLYSVLGSSPYSGFESMWLSRISQSCKFFPQPSERNSNPKLWPRVTLQLHLRITALSRTSWKGMHQLDIWYPKALSIHPSIHPCMHFLHSISIVLL